MFPGGQQRVLLVIALHALEEGDIVGVNRLQVLLKKCQGMGLRIVIISTNYNDIPAEGACSKRLRHTLCSPSSDCCARSPCEAVRGIE